MGVAHLLLGGALPSVFAAVASPPAPPKKGKNGYMFFTDSRWADLVKKNPKKVKRGAVKADKPKRKPSAYSMFIKDQASSTMKSMGTTKVTEAMSELAKKWKGMTDKAKNKYVKQAAAAAAEME